MPARTMIGKYRVDWNYITDWVVTLILIAIFFSLDKVHGFYREFSLTDKTIQYTYATHERVPVWALYMIAVVAPFAITGAVNLFTVKSLADWHNSCLGLLLSLSLTGSLTQIVKVTVGRPRPDFIDRCQPLAGSTNRSPYGLATSAICTQTDMSILKDGFRSFFSGHSSLSFAGLGFLSWYLAGKLGLFSRRGHSFSAWISITPLAAALLVAISRTMDYRHHWEDVSIGAIVGGVISFFAYRQYYPALTALESGRCLRRSESSYQDRAVQLPESDDGLGSPTNGNGATGTNGGSGVRGSV